MNTINLLDKSVPCGSYSYHLHPRNAETINTVNIFMLEKEVVTNYKVSIKYHSNYITQSM